MRPEGRGGIQKETISEGGGGGGGGGSGLHTEDFFKGVCYRSSKQVLLLAFVIFYLRLAKCFFSWFMR